jgi:hypothetical protein
VKAKPGPSLRISELPPGDIDLVEGRSARIICQACGRWSKVKRGLVEGHAALGTTARCDGTAQHVIFDLTPRQFARTRSLVAETRRVQRYAQAKSAAIDPAVRRSTTAHGVHYKPVVTPLHKMQARDTAPQRSQLEGWSGHEPAFTESGEQPWNTARLHSDTQDR